MPVGSSGCERSAIRNRSRRQVRFAPGADIAETEHDKAQVWLGDFLLPRPARRMESAKALASAGHETYVGDDNRIRLNYHVRAFIKSALSLYAIDISATGVANNEVANRWRRH